MSSSLLVAYFFTAFVAGTLCIGAVFVLAYLRGDELARSFLWFYLPASMLVLAGLALAILGSQATASSTLMALLAYLESFIGRYGVMLALPLFVHRLFGVHSPRRDFAVIGVVAATFVGQHVTEFALAGSVWDARGDLVEDVAFASLAVYSIFTAMQRRKQSVYPPFTRRFNALLLLATPAVVFDLFLVDGPGFRLTPLLYALGGAVMVFTLVGRYSATGVAPAEWRLTEREEQVLGLLQQGLSTREIAAQLAISPNTVKTHLRGIFDKSGLRSRFALISHLRPPPTG